jgi:peptidoglycan/LPS O-acetylase OafA/YrhL
LPPVFQGQIVTAIPYRKEIDGLRAIAVLAVVFYHAGFWFHGGMVGVDVFFVISGYLITSLLYREREATGRIDLFAFYARRVRRIIPALVLVVVVTVFASALLLSPIGEIKRAAQSGAASLLFVANFFFQFHSGGYFDPSSDRMPLLHVWSLGVEEQFYLLWPIGLIALLRLRHTSVVAIVIGCGLASLAIAEVLMYSDPQAAFYQMPARFWELAVGGLIALRPSMQLTDGRVPAALGVLVVLAATLVPIAHFPGIGAAPAVLGAGLLLYAIHGSERLGWAGALLRSRPMVSFGLISYSLYLWHWPLLALQRATQAGELSMQVRAVTCVVATVLAWASYRFVEQPLRRPDASISSRKLVVCAVVVLVTLAYVSLDLGDALDQPPPPDDPASRAARDMPQNRIACNYQGADSLDVFPRPHCNSTDDKPLRVAIWGDSHALAWQPFAWALASRQGVAATSYTRDACGPALDYDNGKHPLEAQRCREFNKLVAGHLDGIQTLIVSSTWPPSDDFAAKFDATIRLLSPRVKKILLLGPTPYMRDSVPQCIASHNLPACATTRHDYELQTDTARKLLHAIAAKYPNVEYVELEDFFCDAQSCPAMKDGYALYWDTNHVASTAARAFFNHYIARASLDALPQKTAPQQK